MPRISTYARGARRPRLNAVDQLAWAGFGQKGAPEGGWTAEEFAKDGERLITGIANSGIVAQRRGIKAIHKTVKTAFDKQLLEVIRLAKADANRNGVKGTKAEITLEFRQHEHIWASAIRKVFEEKGLPFSVELVTAATPGIQSVMAQGYSKTSVALGQEATGFGSAEIARQARKVAQQITVVDGVTRDRIERIIRDGVSKGMTVQEVAGTLIDKVPKLHASRALTIARTEMNRVWNQGSTTAMKENGGITHVSVIGCESREADQWGSASYQQFMFRGESTCNIQDVPIENVDELNFHPNHTGNIVPSKFGETGGSQISVPALDPPPKPAQPSVEETVIKRGLERMAAARNDLGGIANPLMKWRSFNRPKKTVVPELRTSATVGDVMFEAEDTIKPTVQKVNLKDIGRAKGDNDHWFKELDEDTVKGFIEDPNVAVKLADDAEKYPVFVKIEGDDMHYIVDGRSRTAAAAFRGEKEITARVYDVPKRHDIRFEVVSVGESSLSDVQKLHTMMTFQKFPENVQRLPAQPGTHIRPKGKERSHYQRGAYLHTRDSHIQMGKHTEESGVKYERVYAHEYGHHLHNATNIVDSWNQGVDKDFFKLVGEMGQKNLHLRLFTKKKANGEVVPDGNFYQTMSNTLKDMTPDMTDAVRQDFLNSAELRDEFGTFADIIDALTKGKYGQGHGAAYYTRDLTSTPAEIFAHGFQTMVTGNRYVEHYFPELVEFIERRVEKLEPKDVK